MFSHEKFEAYQLSLEYWESALKLLNEIPSGNSVIRDQLERAASSIALNLAEGCGRVSTDDRKKFYTIARGSAMECAALADLITRLEPMLSDKAALSKKKLLSIVRILSTIILK